VSALEALLVRNNNIEQALDYCFLDPVKKRNYYEGAKYEAQRKYGNAPSGGGGRGGGADELAQADISEAQLKAERERSERERAEKKAKRTPTVEAVVVPPGGNGGNKPVRVVVQPIKAIEIDVPPEPEMPTPDIDYMQALRKQAAQSIDNDNRSATGLRLPPFPDSPEPPEPNVCSFVLGYVSGSNNGVRTSPRELRRMTS
jgi:hypothetical protein